MLDAAPALPWPCRRAARRRRRPPPARRDRHRAQHLQPDSALARDDGLVVIRMDETSRSDRASAWPGLRRGCSMQDHLGAKVASALHLHTRREVWYDDHRAQAEALSMVGDAPCAWLPGRHRVMTPGSPADGQLASLLQAPRSERSGELQVLEFEEHLRAGEGRQRARFDAWGVQHLAREPSAAVSDMSENWIMGRIVVAKPDAKSGCHQGCDAAAYSHRAQPALSGSQDRCRRSSMARRTAQDVRRRRVGASASLASGLAARRAGARPDVLSLQLTLAAKQGQRLQCGATQRLSWPLAGRHLVACVGVDAGCATARRCAGNDLGAATKRSRCARLPRSPYVRRGPYEEGSTLYFTLDEYAK